MVRIALGVIVGFFTWAIVWFGSETVLSAIWPDFASHQAAFQEAIEHGGTFTADPSKLVKHIALALIVSAIAGFVAGSISGENKRAPIILGFLLLAVGLMKAAMSWPYVPVWYHVLFTVVLLPSTVIGGKLKTR